MPSLSHPRIEFNHRVYETAEDFSIFNIKIVLNTLKSTSIFSHKLPIRWCKWRLPWNPIKIVGFLIKAFVSFALVLPHSIKYGFDFLVHGLWVNFFLFCAHPSKSQQSIFDELFVGFIFLIGDYPHTLLIQMNSSFLSKLVHESIARSHALYVSKSQAADEWVDKLLHLGY